MAPAQDKLYLRLALIEEQDTGVKNGAANPLSVSNPDTLKQIPTDAFKEAIEFYNQNESSFLKFEDALGLNPWFLNHFRTYFAYRNYLIKKNSSQSPSFAQKSKVKVPVWRKFSRSVSELSYMLMNYRSPNKSLAGNVLISNSTDVVQGENVRFGNIDLGIIHNRVVFDVKRLHSKSDFALESSTNSDSILLAYLFRFSFVSDLVKFGRRLSQLLNEVSLVKGTLEESRYRKIFKLFSKDRFFFYLMYVRFRSFEEYFKKTEIKGLLLSDENSPQQKVIQYAAKRTDIIVYAFQHGNIHPLHPAYMYAKYLTKPTLPKITFTWGTYFADLLCGDGGYPRDKVKAIGRIPFPLKLKVKNPALKEEGYILYASQPHRDPKFRHQLFSDILNVVKELSPKLRLVVRPHPREKSDVFFNGVAKDVGFFDFLIDRESDLNTHFEMCSALLVAFSTVGTEFVSYFKPLFVLDYYNQDLINWIEAGVGIPIPDKQTLREKLSSNQVQIDRAAHESFVKKYYRCDEGVLEEIKRLINDR